MKNTLAIFEKEIQSYFTSPIAYIVLAVFWLVSGYFFSFTLFYTNVGSMATTFHNISIILILLAPVITMRLFSEEKKSGTLELLLTLPVKSYEIVLGKFLAATALYLIMIAGTLIYLVPLFLYGDPDSGPIVSGYIGAILLGLSFLSIGILTSTLSKNQIIAAVLSLLIILILWFIDYVASFQSRNLEELIAYFSISHHYTDFLRGIINTKSALYYLTITFLGLFFTEKSLELKR